MSKITQPDKARYGVRKITQQFSIEVRPEDDAWIVIAKIPGQNEIVSQGNSAAQAVESIAECLKMLTDECKEPNISHCWCRSESRSDEIGGNYNGLVCCICGTWKKTEEHDD